MASPDVPCRIEVGIYVMTAPLADEALLVTAIALVYLAAA